MANQIKFKVGFDVDKTNLNQLKSSLQQIQKLSISDVMKINNTNPTQAKEALTKIKEQAKNIEIALKTAFNVKLNTINIEKFNQSLKGSSSSIEQVYKAFKGAGVAGENTFRSLSAQVLSTNIQLKQTHSLLDKMAITFANTIKWNISSAVFNTMTNSIQQAWNFTKALDSSLNDIRIVTGKSADEMADFAVKANEAAQSLGKSTKDYTNASLIYAQQGLSDEEIEARTNITLKTANVTGQTASDVSEQLTAVWNGYKVSAEEAEIYVDRLAAVAAKSASNLEELSVGMSKVASAAATMGVSEEQLAAQLSTIISVTRQAPQTVGTALKTVYARITDIQAGLDSETSLGNYSGKMAEFGINVLDANNKLRDMGEVIEEIGGKWSTMTREQQVALAQTMGGQRQYSNLVALFDNFDKYNNMMQVATNAQGTLQEQQNTYMQRTTAHLQQLSTAAENLYMNLVDNDSINGLIDGLTTVIGLTTTWVQSIGGLGTLLTGLGGIGLNVFSEQIAKGINTMISNSEKANGNVKQIEDSLKEVQKWQGIPELDNFTKQLLDSRQQMLELAHLMSPEQFSGIQNTLNDLTQAGNAVAELAEKREKLNKTVEETFKNNSRVNGLEQALASPFQQKIIMERFQQYETRLDNFKKFVGQSFKAIKNLNIEIIDEKDIGSFKSKVEAINKEFETIFKKNKFNRNLIPQSQIANFEKLENKFNSLKTQLAKPNADVGKIARELQMVYAQISGIINNSAQGMEQTIADLAKFFEGGSDEISKALDQAITKAESFKAQLEVAARTELIQGFSQLGGSILQIGSAIQQIQNLGSIWQNNDLSTGEKILQTFIALGTTIPTLVTGLNSFKQAIDLLNQSEKTRAELGKVVAVTEELEAKKSKEAAAANVAETVSNKAEEASEEGLTAAKLKEQLATGKATIASGLHTAAQTVETAATGILTGAVEALSLALSTLAANPILLVIGGAAAIIGGITAAVTAYNKSIENSIEKNKEAIDIEKQKREELLTTQKLLQSARELNEQYKAGEITRAELKSGIQDLIDEYGAEDEVVKILTEDINNLGESIDNLEKINVKQAKESAEDAYSKASKNLLKTAKKGVGHQFGDSYYIDFYVDNQDVLDALYEIGNVQENIFGESKDYQFKIDFDEESIVELYDKLSKVSTKLGEDTPEAVADWLKKMKEPVETYRQTLEDLKRYTTEFAAIDQKLNFRNLDNATDYLKNKNILISQIVEQLGKTTEQAQALADAFIKQNYRENFLNFDETADYLEQLRENFGKNSEVEKMISELSSEQLGVLENLNPGGEVIKNWNTLRQIIEKISKTDFSNIKNPFTRYAAGDSEAAYENFTKYQSLEDQVKSGKGVSSKELESLEPELQGFFSRMANGTYKMTGDSKQFYELVNSMKLDGFEQTLGAINDEIEALTRVGAGNFDYSKLNEQSAINDSERGYDANLLNQQLDYLDAVAATNSELDIQVGLWRDLAQKNKLSLDSVEDIYEAIGEVGNKTKDIKGQTDALKEKAEEVAHQLYDAMFPTDSDVDTSALASLTQVIENIAESSDDLADGLKKDSRAAEDVAESILRFDDAVQDVVKNYEDWMVSLKNGSLQDQAEAVEGLRDAYADLLDLDGSSLSNDFLTSADNLQLMKQAINGDTDAYNQLLDLAGQDILAHIQIDPTQVEEFQNQLDNIKKLLDNKNFPDLEVGASLNDKPFLQSLTNMVNAAGMTAQQATDFLSTMGVDAEVVEDKRTEKVTRQYTGAIAKVDTYPIDWINPITENKVHSDVPSITYTQQPIDVTDTQENTAFGLKVTSAKKSSGGNFKFKQSKSGGGSSGAKRRSSSGKKGGGGSGSKADTSQKDLKKPLEDERDIYHDINIEIEQINRELERTQKTQDKLYGKQLLDNLNKQSQILENHKAKLKEKQKIQQQDLKTQQDILKSLKVTFDAYGNISNYMDILAQKQATTNKLTKEYNKLVEQYNASTNKDTKTKINEKIEAKSKEVQEAEEARKNLEDKIKDYDNLKEAMEDLVDDIEDETQQQIEIAITKFRMQLEIRLDLGEAEKDWNEFKRKVINNTNIIKDSEFSKIFKDAQTNVEDLLSYFDVHGSQGSISKLTEQLADTRAEIQAIDKTGESAIYGENKAQAMEDLKSDLDTLIDRLEEIQDLVDDIDESYLDTIDDINDGFDKQIEDYELVSELLEHDMDLLTLLYGEKNYNAMDRYYATLKDNQNKQIDSLQQQRDFWKAEWDAAVARGDTAAAQKFKEHYTDVLKNLNSTIEDAAQTLQDKYTNAIDKIFDELDKRISSNKGTDYLELEWELMNKNADEYLDTINSAFKLQELQTKFTKALNDTKSLKGQKEIKKLMDEQLNNLKAKEKLTEYDVQRAEKLLQIEQARIALEDAQSSKTTMRLKRDSQGNYSYQFVANNDDMLEAQQNLADAQNDLYNFDKERYYSNLNDMISAWKDFQSQYKEIQLDTSLTEEQRVRQLALLRKEYGEYINNKVAENQVIRGNLIDSAFADYAALYNIDVENYQEMSDEEKNILMNDLIPAWNSGVQDMANTFAGEGGFIQVCTEAFEQLDEVSKGYQKDLERLFINAGINSNELKDSVDNLVDEYSSLIEKNDDLINRMGEELKAIEGLRDSAKALIEQYNRVYEAAKKMTSAIHEYYQEQQKQAAEEAKKEATTKPTTTSKKQNTTKTTTSKKQNTTKTTTSKKQNTTKTTTSKKQNTTSKKQNTTKTTSAGDNFSNNKDATNNDLTSIILLGGEIAALTGLKAGASAQIKTKKQASTKLQAKAVAKSIGTKAYSQANTSSYQNYLKSKYSGSYEDYLKLKVKKYDSGGYTGDWSNDEGRLAILHKKELVLNSSDTENMLSIINLTREVMKNLNNSAFMKMLNISNLIPRNEDANDTIEQNVRIEASFPNINSKREIEEAFNDLVNLAAQRAMKR